MALPDRLAALLACPTCGGDLAEEREALHCQSCELRYPIMRGIPRFVSDDGYAESFGYQWNRHRREQIDSANGLDLSHRRLDDETGWGLESLADSVVLDAGCGAGRFTEAAARHARHVVAVDISSAIDAAALTVADRDNVDLVQASLTALPFKDEVFDALFCIGVAQHTPEPQATLSALPRVIRRGGRLAVTMYERRPWTLANGKYLVRPATRRLRPRTLSLLLRVAMPLLFAVTEVAFRLPVVGRVFRFVLPVANYVGQLPLDTRQRYSWALLDTFDMLSPRYDQPMTEAEARSALDPPVACHRRTSVPGLNLVGRRSS